MEPVFGSVFHVFDEVRLFQTSYTTTPQHKQIVLWECFIWLSKQICELIIHWKSTSYVQDTRHVRWGECTQCLRWYLIISCLAIYKQRILFNYSSLLHLLCTNFYSICHLLELFKELILLWRTHGTSWNNKSGGTKYFEIFWSPRTKSGWTKYFVTDVPS